MRHNCANCSWHFPPRSPYLDGKCVICILYPERPIKRASSKCGAWKLDEGEPSWPYTNWPEWCYYEDKRRIGPEIRARFIQLMRTAYPARLLNTMHDIYSYAEDSESPPEFTLEIYAAMCKANPGYNLSPRAQSMKERIIKKAQLNAIH